mmetsp:Transcript_29636/g.62320  ORF Transcript_29636/g.62320 Transcript_29636/m.62320 type:complete len:842 (-) Transcript_29636:136-2661(-)
MKQRRRITSSYGSKKGKATALASCATTFFAMFRNSVSAQEGLFSDASYAPTGNSSSTSPEAINIPSLIPTPDSFSPSPTEIQLNTTSSRPSTPLNESFWPSVSFVPSRNATLNPSLFSSSSPSLSKSPTFTPTAAPTNDPTMSSYPSYLPSVSSHPSSSPTSSQPTSVPSRPPTGSPIIAPSASPSMEFPVSFERSYLQNIYVSHPQSFTVAETLKFQFLMERYTAFFGYNISKPQIVTRSTITSQNIAIDPVPVPSRRVSEASDNLRNLRRLENNGDIGSVDISTSFFEGLFRKLYHRYLQTTEAYLLTIRFSMNYTTRFDYDISNYNKLFADFINSNTTQITYDLSSTVGLPVVNVGPVIILSTSAPTAKPTPAPTSEPTEAPSHSTKLSTLVPSFAPSPSDPSDVPSASPTKSKIFVDTRSDSFVLGLSLGLSGALVIGIVAYCYFHNREKAILKESEGSTPSNLAFANQSEMNDFGPLKTSGGTDEKNIVDGNDDNHRKVACIETPVLDNVTVGESETNSPDDPFESHIDTFDRNEAIGTLHCELPQSACLSPAIESGPDVENSAQSANHTRDSIFSMLSLSPDNDSSYNNMFALPYRDDEDVVATNDATFHSESDDDLDPFQFTCSRDELDDYKNQDLELLRTLVVESIDGVEGIVSMALTAALVETEDSMCWVIERSHEWIEVVNMFETYDWIKKNEHTSLEATHEYFQEVLNRVVLSVLFQISNPVQAARLAHGCAAILGLELIKELPQTVLVIQGMRKLSELDQGKKVIIDAFTPFGDIEDAAIVPSRGFGYVRFKEFYAAKKALEKCRVSEIEIQDVSVSVKLLKRESHSFR